MKLFVHPLVNFKTSLSQIICFRDTRILNNENLMLDRPTKLIEAIRIDCNFVCSQRNYVPKSALYDVFRIHKSPISKLFPRVLSCQVTAAEIQNELLSFAHTNYKSTQNHCYVGSRIILFMWAGLGKVHFCATDGFSPLRTDVIESACVEYVTSFSPIQSPEREATKDYQLPSTMPVYYFG